MEDEVPWALPTQIGRSVFGGMPGIGSIVQDDDLLEMCRVRCVRIAGGPCKQDLLASLGRANEGGLYVTFNLAKSVKPDDSPLSIKCVPNYLDAQIDSLTRCDVSQGAEFVFQGRFVRQGEKADDMQGFFYGFYDTDQHTGYVAFLSTRSIGYALFFPREE